MPALSVVIPTQGRDALAPALERLAAQTADDFELLVVSDAQAAPETMREALSRAPAATRHIAGAPLAPGPKRNLGWRAASAPLVLFLDEDILADPGLIEAHLAAHAEHPRDAVGVLGRVRWADSLRTTPFMSWLENGVLFDYGALDEAFARGWDEAGWGRFYTCNVSVKRSLLERAGGFDELNFEFGYEDLDLAKRMYELAGLRLLYRPQASAEHLQPYDLERWRATAARMAVSERRFVARHPDVPPYFFNLFSAALASPRARRRGARLARLVPRSTPWLGARVWASAEAGFAQELAPSFMAAWESAPANTLPPWTPA